MTYQEYLNRLDRANNDAEKSEIQKEFILQNLKDTFKKVETGRVSLNKGRLEDQSTLKALDRLKMKK